MFLDFQVEVFIDFLSQAIMELSYSHFQSAIAS